MAVLLALVALAVLAGVAWPLTLRDGTAPRRSDQVPGPSVDRRVAGLLAAPRETAAKLADLKVMNYYPVRNNWTRMWTSWDPRTIDADFARIAALHADAVRVILQADVFGYPTPQPAMLARLAHVVGLAHAHGLRVQLTLFDWWASYGDLAGSRRWARAVLAPYAGDPRIAFIELQNEIDPTSAAAMTWARQMIPYMRGLSGDIPLTLSISGTSGLKGLRLLVDALTAPPPDFYTYHFYGDVDAAYQTFAQAQRLVAPAPLFIGESGFATVGGASPAALEAEQDHYYRTVQYAARALGLPPVAPWTLTDFAPGSLTWTEPSSIEYDYGVFRTNGTPKPIAASLRAFFGSGRIDTSFDNGFESAASALPAEWSIFPASGAQFARDTAVSHTGRASARIAHSGNDLSGAPAFYTTPIVNIVPGHAYTATVWVRGQNASGENRVTLAWFNASGAYLGQSVSELLPPGTTAWRRLTVYGVAPRDAAAVNIFLESAYNRGEVWFDDVTFQ